MPPRSSLTSSFSIADSTNEVVCPLHNQDGSSCRKRCLGEKRYRSMQEHIRRAHPEHYISKLPATEESFLLMISTPPSDRSQQAVPQNAGVQQAPQHHAQSNSRAVIPVASDAAVRPYPHDPHGGLTYPHADQNGADTPRNLDEFNGGGMLPTASAAAALAQLGQMHKQEQPEYDSGEDWQSDNDSRRAPRTTIELPPIHGIDHPADSLGPLHSARQPKHLLPSILSNSPPGRSSTLPPLQRSLGPNRSRRQSVSKRSHKKQKSRGSAADWLRRIQNPNDRLRPGPVDHRKAFSVEPSVDYGKRWEDLIDAAASATEDIEDDRTPVSLYRRIDPALLTSQVPQSPVSMHRASLPPFPHQNFHGYQASPLQQALTPPSFAQEAPEPFPSVESGESGENFHMGPAGLSDSSPSYSAQDVHIYCAACQKASRLKESYACTECVCGLCRECVNVLMEEQGARRKCPRCATIGGRFKPFQLDIR